MTIFEFSDYREFIKKRIEELRDSHEGFTFRQFAAEAGFKSPNFLKLIMDGKRNMSIEGSRKVANGLKLGIKEAEYFELLVLANQSTDITERAELTEKLMRLRARHLKREYQAVNYDYYKSWFNIVIREALLVPVGSPIEKLGAAFVPKLSEKEIKAALETMAGLGLIRRNKDGKWEPTEETVRSNDFFSNSAILAFHQKMMQLGQQSLENFRGNEREIGAVTIALSPRGVEKIRALVKELRAEALAIAESDRPKQDVYQLNLQFFPLTRKLSNG